MLDNCEHLLEGAAALAGVLQRSCERLVILATSREGLGIDGERLVPVPPLATPGADADLDAIREAEAVRLFAERAAAVKPGFAVTAENAAAVGRGGPAPGWDRAGGRAGGGAGARDDPGRAGPAAGAQLRRARGRPARRGGTSPDAAGHDRLVLPAARRARAGPAGPAGGVRRRLPPWRRPRRSAAGRASTRTRCSSCWRAWWRGRWWWPRNRGPRPATGCWRRSASTARNASAQAGETERWRARHASYYADLLQQVRDHAHDPNPEVFWAVRLSAEQDNLLAAWSWAIGTGNVGTAFQMLAGFAPVEVWTSLPAGAGRRSGPGAARRGRAPGLPARPGGQRRVRRPVRADVAGAEELCPPGGRSQRASRYPGLAGRGDHLRRPRKHRDHSAARSPTPPASPNRPPVIARAGGDLADASVQLNARRGRSPARR